MSVTSRANCPLCIAGTGGRHPDNGGTHPGRTPHRGDPIELYDERMTVLDLIDRGMGWLIVAEDDAGSRIERYADRLVWDADARAWRAVA